MCIDEASTPVSVPSEHHPAASASGKSRCSFGSICGLQRTNASMLTATSFAIQDRPNNTLTPAICLHKLFQLRTSKDGSSMLGVKGTWRFRAAAPMLEGTTPSCMRSTAANGRAPLLGYEQALQHCHLRHKECSVVRGGHRHGCLIHKMSSAKDVRLVPAAVQCSMLAGLGGYHGPSDSHAGGAQTHIVTQNI